MPFPDNLLIFLRLFLFIFLQWDAGSLVWRNPNHHPPFLHPFNSTEGAGIAETSDLSPLQCFELFVNDDLYNYFVAETNRFAHQYIDEHQNLPRYSRVHDWVDVDRQEMKKFLGLMLLMGIVHKPAISMYWSTDVLYQTPIYTEIMRRNRFQLILKFLHFNDNSKAPATDDANRDRLYKIRPLIDHLCEKFQEAYTPGPSVAVDETLLLWKGRLAFRQYLPLKRSRFGIKMFCLSEVSGYTYKFRIYTGKQDPATDIANFVPDECSGFSSSEKVVIYLMMPLLDKGYTLWSDNWYTSCRLYSYLHHRKTTACGTIRCNRAPTEIRREMPVKGQSVALRCEELLCLKYKDKKDVYMLTTQHDESAAKITRRRGRPSSDPDLDMKPVCIIEYNQNMGGVDKQDQFLQPYSAARKSMKWYKKLAVHLIQVALLNAFILKKKTDVNLTFERFQHDVIADLIFSDGDEDCSNEAKQETLARLTGRHFPELLVPTETWTKPQARCRVCSKKQIRRDVKTICPTCPDKPGLCTSPCFKLWHTKLRYWE